MNGQEIMGGIVAVKAAVDTIKSVLALLRSRRIGGDLVPVYRPMPRGTGPGSEAGEGAAGR